MDAGDRRRCRARGRYACRAAEYPSPIDFSTGLGVGLDIEGGRDKIDTLANAHRSWVGSEQRARPSLVVQQTPDCQSDRFGLVAARHPLGGPFDQGDDVRSIDGDDVCHTVSIISYVLI